MARPLSPAEQRDVARRLSASEGALFWRQSPADQRHAHTTMRRAAVYTEDRSVLRAALLHDVGKAASSLGPIARSVATLLDVLGIRLPHGMGLYRAHGEIGAEALESLGAEPLVVDFARRHPDPDPRSSNPTAWRILLEADGV